MSRKHKLLTLFAAQTYAQKVSGIFGANLVGYWPLNELSGTTATDRSATGANGTYGSAVTLAAAAGPGPSMGLAPSFPGAANGNITFGAGSLTALSNAWNPDELTLSLWFKIVDVAHWNDANGYVLFTIGHANSLDVDYLLWKSSANALTIHSFRMGTALRTRTGTNELGWHNATAVVSASADKLQLYFDGAQVGTDTAVGSSSGGALISSVTQIGSSAGGNLWPGNIDHVILAKVAATPAQVAQLAMAS